MSAMTVIAPWGAEVDDAPGGAVTLAPRAPLAGRRLLLVGNGKPKTEELLTLVAERLVERAGLASVTFHGKPDATHPIDGALARTFAEDHDVVLAGLGDCGACSACSLHDAFQFEELGLPATVLITEPFQARVASFAATLGLVGYPVLTVPHPVATRGFERLQAMADRVIDSAIVGLEGRHVVA